MNARTLRILEYEKILAALSKFAVGEPGAQLCLNAVPKSDIDQVRSLINETASAETFWVKNGANPMESYNDCRQAAEKCSAGALATPAELLEVAKTLRAIRLVKNKLSGAEGKIAYNADRLVPSKTVEDEIFRCIISEDEIADNASPALKDLRKAIRNANEKIRLRLQSLISSPEYKNMLQDSIVTQRNGRYVVPVKAEYVNTIKGLEHDRSNSGATVFVEPISVLEANNELKELEVKERQEIEKILLNLSQMVGSIKDSLYQSTQAMAELDFVFSRAALSRSMNAVMPSIVEADSVKIDGARHPLIESEKVVPIDIVCGGEIRALIITGPNTGGKTVTLKTIGLFCAMAQAGLFLPCSKAELPVFRDILADIGDEQSIEQSLSTFSSHMTNIVEIINKAHNQVLVLLDEIGAGTDPVEGAALAIAILKKLKENGAVCVATTHYSEIKTFAMTNKGYLNACMEFDVITLQPTYKLIIGFAGSSNAFEISKRLGVPQDVIDNAKSLIDTNAAKLESVLSSAEELRLKAQREYEEARQHTESETLRLNKERMQLYKQLEEEKTHIEKLKTKVQKELDAARELANEAIEQARAAARAENAKQREQALVKAKEKIKAMEELRTELSEQYEGEPPKTLEIGDIVFVTTANTTATVLSKPDDKGEVQLQAGIIKLTANLSVLRKVQQKSKKADKTSTRIKRQEHNIPLELDIRGLTVDEAIMVVDTHLDAVVMAGLHETTIIHGKGTGALRAGIREYLKNHPHVKRQRAGNYGEGEDGVTVVELK